MFYSSLELLRIRLFLRRPDFAHLRQAHNILLNNLIFSTLPFFLWKIYEHFGLIYGNWDWISCYYRGTSDSILFFCRHSDIWFVWKETNNNGILFRNFTNLLQTVSVPFPLHSSWTWHFFGWKRFYGNFQDSRHKSASVILQIFRQTKIGKFYFCCWFYKCVKIHFTYVLLRSFHDVVRLWHWKEHRLWMNGLNKWIVTRCTSLRSKQFSILLNLYVGELDFDIKSPKNLWMAT